MDKIMEVFSWIVANWETLVGIITGLVTIASAICALTPTVSDDTTVEKWKVRIYKLIEILALNIGKAKQ
jgi:hypothetical protein